MSQYIWNGDFFIVLGLLSLVACILMIVRKDTNVVNGAVMMAAMLTTVVLMLAFTRGHVHNMDLVTLAFVSQAVFFQRFFKNVADRKRRGSQGA